MSNALYAKGKEAILSGAVNIASGSIKVIGVTSDYAPDVSSDQYLSIVGAHTVGTATALASKTETNGVLDAADVTFASVASGAAMAALVIFSDTGDASTSPLLALIDTATGLPVTPNGGDIKVTWNADGIFAL